MDKVLGTTTEALNVRIIILPTVNTTNQRLGAHNKVNSKIPPNNKDVPIINIVNPRSIIRKVLNELCNLLAHKAPRLPDKAKKIKVVPYIFGERPKISMR